MNQRYLLFLFAMMMAFPLWSQQKISVEVSSNQFTPADITINVGDTVEWTNVQGFHNVDGRTSTYPNNPESFFSGSPAGPGWTYEHVFSAAGTYDYDCTPHAGLGMVGTVTVEAPAATARLQIVHNAPSPTVDIWVNGQPFETDFEFRTATEYREVPAGVLLNVGIAPSPSTSVNDTIVNFPITLQEGETYQVIAYGVVGDMNTPFDLKIINPARESAEGGSGVDFTVFHGSPDAPAVDVFARDVAQIVDGAPYGANTPYQNVPAADYILDVKADNTEPIVASFSAPLSGLDGGAGLVMASGFLNPGMGDPAFGLFAVLPDGTVLELPQVQNTAQLQVVHNSPSPTVDIWVNGQPYETDFAFRTATEYREVPAGVVLNVGIAPSPSTSVDDTIVNYELILDPDEVYQVIAYGVVGDMNTPFDLQIITPARAAAEGGSGVDFTVFHGSPDAPAVDVFARDVAQIVDGAPYGANTPYQNVPAADYILDVKADNTEPIVASFSAPLSGLDGGAALVMASGFLNPGMGDPAFGLFAVLADGTVLELPQVENTARLQLVHNLPNPTVDIWVNGQPYETSFAYRTATEYREVPAGTILNVGIAPTPSSSVDDTLANFQVLLEPDQSYQVIANGILGNPDTPFELAVITPSREAAESGDGVDFTVFHGSPDAPAVDVFARGVAQIVDGAAYGANTPYQNVPAADYILDIKADNTDPIVASFAAPLSGLNGGAATVMASGFLNPDMNQPAFGLFAILPDGTVIELPAVQNTARLQVVHNSPSPTVDIWVNGQPYETDFAFRTATEYRDVPAGALLNVGIAPSPSTSVEDTIVNFQFILDPDATYQLIAYGVVGDMNTPFDLKVITPAREAAEGGSGVDFTVFHGSPDAPNVDVFARGVAQIVDDAPYGANTPYQNVPAADYTLDVKQAGTDPTVAAFSAPLSGLDGGAATVMASGFLTPEGDEPAFGLFAVLPDGTVIELPLITNVNQAFDGVVKLYPNPVVSSAILELDLEPSASGNVEIDLINIQGQQVGRIFDGPIYSGLNRIDFNAATYTKGQYFIRVSNDQGVSIFPMLVQ